MKKITVFRHEEKGAVLITTLLISMALLILIMPFLSKLSGQYRSTDKSFKSLVALNLAEAGVDRAIWELNNGDISIWDGNQEERTLTLSSLQSSGGSVAGDVVITVSGLIGTNPVILSSGKVPFRNSDTIDKTLRVVLEKSDQEIFAYGLFATDGIDFAGNSYVDGYDSRDGDYKGHNKGLDVSIGTNAIHLGAITLDDKAKVVGDAYIGFEGDPEDILVLDRAKITGEKSSMDETFALPPVTAPEGLPYMGEIETKKKIKIEESGEYTSIYLEKKGELKIEEDVTLYVTGDFFMENGSKITIKEGVNFQLYLGSSFSMEHGAQFNKHSEDPTKLQVWGTPSFTGDFVLDSDNEFCGAIYIPQGNLYITGNIEYYGSISAKTINIDANTKLHYDRALLDIPTPFKRNYYTVRSWQEKLIP